MLELSDYQVVAQERLLLNPKYGLFDEMGVGKTAVAITSAAKLASRRWPILVTSPAYLMWNWKREIEMWCPGATIGVAQGERNQRTPIVEGNADFLLVNYHMWHTYPQLQKRKWGHMIFDESHRIRGRNSQWTKKLFQLQNVGERNRETGMWHLTGTPLVRDAGDLWPFLHLMDRHLYKSYWRFVDTHCYITQTPWETIVGEVRDPDFFTSVMRRYSLRRLCRDIPELSTLEHSEKLISLSLPPSVETSLRRAKKEYFLDHPNMESIDFDSGGSLIQKLLELSTLCPTKEKPKLDTAYEIVTQEAPNERCGVFTWYRSSAKAVAERIGKRAVLFTGDQSTRQKLAALEQYDKDPTCVFVGTIAACKEGLNLQKGKTCIFVEEADLEEDNNQVIGRFKRRGQKQVVRVYRLLAGPIDQAKHRAVVRRDRDVKRAMLEELLHDET